MPKPQFKRNFQKHKEPCFCCSRPLEKIKGEYIYSVILLDGHERKFHIVCARTTLQENPSALYLADSGKFEEWVPTAEDATGSPFATPEPDRGPWEYAGRGRRRKPLYEEYGNE